MISETFPYRLGLRVASVCLVAMTAACQPGSSQPVPEAPPVASLFIRQVPGATGIVVFVHGVLGDPRTTWRNKANASWPELLEKDADFKSDDIYLVGYSSPALKGASNIEEIAQRVSQQLIDQNVFKYQHIYFITHSMGGLIAKRILTELDRPSTVEQLRRVRAVLLISTPSQGAPDATIGEWLSLNPQFKDMKPIDFNTFLRALENDWVQMLIDRERSHEPYPQAFCAYETLPTDGVKIVSSLYATSRCDNKPYPMDYDHVEIVKPTSMSIDPYPWAKARFAEADRLQMVRDAAAQDLAQNVAKAQTSGPPSAEAAKEANTIGDVYAKAAAAEATPEAADTKLKWALDAYSSATTMDPSNSLYFVNTGLTLNKLKRFNAATTTLRKGLALDPTVGWYHSELCTSLVNDGKLQEAETECKAAVRLEPKNGAYHDQWTMLFNRLPGRGR
jgi:predicted alpha/beta hydrolase family esterase